MCSVSIWTIAGWVDGAAPRPRRQHDRLLDLEVVLGTVLPELEERGAGRGCRRLVGLLEIPRSRLSSSPHTNWSPGLGSVGTLFGMEVRDIELRDATYQLFVEHGRAPSAEAVAVATGATVEEVQRGWRRLHDAHALVLSGAGTELRMANPFSAVPTAHRVEAGGRSWYANCAWDAFGVCAALQADGRIETSCPDCGEPLGIDVRGERPDDESRLFHCLVPAQQWWEDIVFT